MTIGQLYYAITIAEAGSFSRAAEQLYLAQPSLTGAMQELEREIGITIFKRGGRGVSVTQDGAEFLLYARQLYSQYELLKEKYGKGGSLKKKFGVSTQHYSFAVKAFVELVRQSDTLQYEFALRETKTREVISDVATLKSEVGVLYLSDFNRAAIQKLLRAGELAFQPLTCCKASVYLWSGHPLAGCRAIPFEALKPYPCLSFEQGDGGSFYFAEEILSTNEYPRTIKVNDRATMLNLMVGLNGYTLCSGIVCEQLNGKDCLTIPLAEQPDEGTMEIGYIHKKNALLSPLAQQYIAQMKSELGVD